MVSHLCLTANFRNREALYYPSCFTNKLRELFFFSKLILLTCKIYTKINSSDSYCLSPNLYYCQRAKGQICWAWTALDCPRSPSIWKNDIVNSRCIHTAIFSMDNYKDILYITGTSAQWYVQPGWEGSLGENEYMHMYGWVPSLFTWTITILLVDYTLT